MDIKDFKTYFEQKPAQSRIERSKYIKINKKMKKFYLFFIFILLGLVFTGISCLKKETATVDYNPQINPSDFTEVIDNQYLTFTPGQKMIYQVKTEEGTERIEVETLNETKEVMGVTCRVVHDQVFLNDQLIENTKDWYAQDKDGNVWYFGEETAEYENGEIISTKGAWEGGIDGALPGIVMYANPEVGQEYRQEYYKGEAEDMGEIIALNEKVEIAYGTFENCLKTRDWTPLEKRVDEYKYYCPEVKTLVKEEGIYSNEIVELIEIQK